VTATIHPSDQRTQSLLLDLAATLGRGDWRSCRTQLRKAMRRPMPLPFRMRESGSVVEVVLDEDGVPYARNETGVVATPYTLELSRPHLPTGRPPKPEREKRERVDIHLSPAEEEEVRRAAAACGLGFSPFARQALLTYARTVLRGG
jgi:hypothetical protein